jgi:hypothetical protein
MLKLLREDSGPLSFYFSSRPASLADHEKHLVERNA